MEVAGERGGEKEADKEKGENGCKVRGDRCSRRADV